MKGTLLGSANLCNVTNLLTKVTFSVCGRTCTVGDHLGGGLSHIPDKTWGVSEAGSDSTREAGCASTMEAGSASTMEAGSAYVMFVH